jgi:D-alanyl-D-alanine carboxypeptidase
LPNDKTLGIAMIRAVKFTFISITIAVLAVSISAFPEKKVQVIKTKTPEQIELIQCNVVCRHEIQAALNDDRLHNKSKGSCNIGEQISISLPGASGLQPPTNFYSGYATRLRTMPVGKHTLNQSDKRVDLFAQGSITKSYVAAIILQLEQEHKLKLHDKIKQYLGNRYPDWNQVTIKQLLNMTSGIVNYTSVPLFTRSFMQPYHRWTPDQMIDIAYNNKKPSADCRNGGNLCFKPGTHYMYSNTAYLLAGKIIENITKDTLAYEMQHRLLGHKSKLGELNNTYYINNYTPTILRRLVHGYGIWLPNLPPSNKWLTSDFTQLNMLTTAADGGNISNAEDIVIWARLLLQTNLVINQAQKKRKRSMNHIY